MIERTTDWEVVKRELESRIDSIGCGMTAEHVPRFEGWLNDEKNWFVVAEIECPEKLSGIFVFLDKGLGIFEAHAATDRKSYGWKWVKLSRDVLRWFFEMTRADEVQTSAPCEDRAARAYLHLLGLRKYGEWGGCVLYHTVRKE